MLLQHCSFPFCQLQTILCLLLRLLGSYQLCLLTSFEQMWHSWHRVLCESASFRFEASAGVPLTAPTHCNHLPFGQCISLTCLHEHCQCTCTAACHRLLLACSGPPCSCVAFARVTTSHSYVRMSTDALACSYHVRLCLGLQSLSKRSGNACSHELQRRGPEQRQVLGCLPACSEDACFCGENDHPNNDHTARAGI